MTTLNMKRRDGTQWVARLTECVLPKNIQDLAEQHLDCRQILQDSRVRFLHPSELEILFVKASQGGLPISPSESGIDEEGLYFVISNAYKDRFACEPAKGGRNSISRTLKDGYNYTEAKLIDDDDQLVFTRRNIRNRPLFSILACIHYLRMNNNPHERVIVEENNQLAAPESDSDKDPDAALEPAPAKNKHSVKKDRSGSSSSKKQPTHVQKTTPAAKVPSSKTLFAGNLSYEIERSDLERFFKEVSEVVDVRLSSHNFKGFGHVEFASAEAAQKALNLNGRSLLGRNVRLELAHERSANNTQRSMSGSSSSSKKQPTHDRVIVEKNNQLAAPESDSDKDPDAALEPAPAKNKHTSIKKDRFGSSSSKKQPTHDRVIVEKNNQLAAPESDSDKDPHAAFAKKKHTSLKKDRSGSSSSKKQPTHDRVIVEKNNQLAAPESDSDKDPDAALEPAPAKNKHTSVKKDRSGSSSSKKQPTHDRVIVEKNNQLAAPGSGSDKDPHAAFAKKKHISLKKDRSGSSSSKKQPTHDRVIVEKNNQLAAPESDSDKDPHAAFAKKKHTSVKKDRFGSSSSKKQPTLVQKTTPAAKVPSSKTLFAGNLSYEIERSDLEHFFKEVSEVVDVRLSSHNFKGFGHVEFASAEAAQKALNLNGRSLLGRNVRLELAHERSANNTQRSSHSGGIGGGSQGQTIFVTGFDSSLSESEIKHDLRTHFSSCGEVARISVPTDAETGAFKGIAFIDMMDGFKKALKLSGSHIRGWKIVVYEARPRGESRAK